MREPNEGTYWLAGICQQAFVSKKRCVSEPIGSAQVHASDEKVGPGAGASDRSLRLVHVICSLCGADDPQPIAVGADFEYRRSDETFLMVRCRSCGLLYLNPRPAGEEAGRGDDGRDGAAEYPPGRLLRLCRRLPARARVLDLCCGDGLRLARLRDFTPGDVRFEGVELDARAVAVARTRGLTVHHGRLGVLALDESSYDLVLGLRTLERSGDPRALLRRIGQLLRPGGTLVLEASNAGSPGSRVFADRYWGGYRFPQVWNLFTPATAVRLAASSGLRVRSVVTRISPLGWIDSLRNVLLDARAPSWLVERFARRAPALLAFFTLVDALGQAGGSGSLLLVTLQRPAL